MHGDRPYDLVIRGGRIVGEHGTMLADVYVSEGAIGAIVEPGNAPLPARATADARGLHVLPGVIDAHTHFRTFSKHSDDFAQMARSAAFGGVTTVIAHIMGMNASPLRPLDRATTFLEEAQAGSAVDYAFHLAIANEPHTLEDIAGIVKLGINSFKMFMAYRARGMQIDDGLMLASMEAIRDAGGMVMVHAEAGDLADQLEHDFRDQNTVLALADSRPTWIEAEATRRALVIAERAGTTPYFVHVSAADALLEITNARAEGQQVLVETCPQYLNLSVDDFVRLGPLAKIAPPLRGSEHVDAMLRAAVSGVVQVIASDHSPYTRADKQLDDLWAVPMGAPGTETLLPATWFALQAQGASISDLVRVLCAEPARVFGLSDRKGTIEVGKDADFTLVDLDAETIIDGDAQHNTSGYSPYDGLHSPLRTVSTYLRGAALLKDGALAAEDGGRFLPRGTAAKREVLST
jgi:D-hydantoinase